MLLYEGFSQIHSQKKARLHFGKSFTLKAFIMKQQNQEMLDFHQQSLNMMRYIHPVCDRVAVSAQLSSNVNIE